MYHLLKTEGMAKRGEFVTVHGTIQTPVFMNVATVAAIKGGLSTEDLEAIGTQVVLSNTYHLHLRPGDDVIYKMGGLHKFMSCNKPILTDSGGFQVFSLAKMRRIHEEGVYFHSHIDGHPLFMGPEESMRIQSHIGSTIAMAFDECPSSRADHEYVQQSVDRTTRWLERCNREMTRLNGLEGTVNPSQMLFGINQGAILMISASNMQRESHRWIWTDMQSAGLLSEKPTSRCIMYWKRQYRICRRISLLI